MKSLIDEQKIRIDNHCWGTGQPNDWDNPSADIHIDKTTKSKYNGKQGKARIKLPINSDRNPTFEINKSTNGQIRSRLTKEIKKAVEDRNRLREFTKELIEILKNYNSTLSDREKTNSAIKRICKHFDLSEEILREMTTYVDQELFSMATIHADVDQRNLYLISFDQRGIEIEHIAKT